MGKLDRPITEWSTYCSPWGGLAVVGALITTLIYCYVPMTSDALLASSTAADIFNQFTSIPTLIGLRFVPVALLVMIGGGLWLLLHRWATGTRVPIAVAVILASGFTVLAYLAPYLTLNKDFNQADTGMSPVSLAGPGFWLALFGALLTAAGAALELRMNRTGRDG